MTEEELRAFLAKVAEDADLKNELNTTGADPIAIARKAGFSVSKDDFKRAPKILSEAELELMGGVYARTGWCECQNGTDPNTRDCPM